MLPTTHDKPVSCMFQDADMYKCHGVWSTACKEPTEDAVVAAAHEHRTVVQAYWPVGHRGVCVGEHGRKVLFCLYTYECRINSHSTSSPLSTGMVDHLLVVYYLGM